jgi:hypothetical protein
LSFSCHSIVIQLSFNCIIMTINDARSANDSEANDSEANDGEA